MPARPAPTLSLIAAALLLAQPCLSDRRVIDQLIGPRPEIQNYLHQDDFVTELLAWQQRKRELEEKLAKGELSLPQPAPQHDWHHITGPEDLDTALQNAEGYVQPNYKEPRRYNRTTHLSFPLPPLPQQKMAEATLPSSPQTDQKNNTSESVIQEKLLDDSARIQRERSASQPATLSIDYQRQVFIGQSELR